MVEARRIPGGDAVLGLVIDKLLREVTLSQARFVKRYRRWIAALIVRGAGYLTDRQTDRPPLGFDDEIHRRN